MRLYKYAKPHQQVISEKATFVSESDMELCVLCGKVTDVPVSEPLEERMNYLPGAGQLCKECAIENIQEEKAAMRSGFVYAMPLYEKENKL